MNNNNSKRTVKHGEVYRCKRYKLLTYLRNKGFIPFQTVPEFENPKYLNWLFKNSSELEDAINEYFNQMFRTKSK